MKLPDNATLFVQSVNADSKKLIEHGLWDIRMSRLESWSKQFIGPEEQFFAACLLDQLIFRTQHQFEAGLRSLFRSNLNGEIFSGSQDLHLSQAIVGRADPVLRLVPVICETDPPTKSGPLVLRRLQRILQANQKWMCWPWQVANEINDKGIRVVVFVDDFLGSGGQFVKFFKQWQFDENADGVRYIYAPVVAHQQGIEHLAKELPTVCVVSAETLDHSHAFFSDAVWERLGRGCVTPIDAKEWYHDFVTQRSIQPRQAGPLGCGDLALTLGFSHSTPNNSLPILWYETDDWQPLLER
ncbi:MAG: hypothetical protein Q8L71_09465 [Thiobacillus sp.]|nr:hypothetical protein [Thiobacillus sp.]